MDQTQMTCCLVCGQETGKYDPLALFLLSYFGLHSRADQNYTGLSTLHFARLKNLQQRYDITTDVRYDRLTRSPNLMVTQGRPSAERAAGALRLHMCYRKERTGVHVYTGV